MRHKCHRMCRRTQRTVDIGRRTTAASNQRSIPAGSTDVSGRRDHIIASFCRCMHGVKNEEADRAQVCVRSVHPETFCPHLTSHHHVHYTWPWCMFISAELLATVKSQMTYCPPSNVRYFTGPWPNTALLLLPSAPRRTLSGSCKTPPFVFLVRCREHLEDLWVSRVR